MTRPLFLACLLATAVESSITLRAAQPNFVMIIADDQAWTDYGFMGHTQIETPHLDQLARESLVFRRGYVPASLCCPSLASLITGRYPHQHKITSNDPPIPIGIAARDFYRSAAFRDGREVMNQHLDAVPTLPRLLAAQGYLCLQTGKWWQGDYRRGGFTHGMTQGDRHGDAGLEIGRKTMQPIDDLLVQAQREQKPFFVWYAPLMPHSPHTPPQKLLDKYQSRTPSPHLARYWAMVEWFDETVGQLLASLDRQHMADNTIVVFLADNGWIQDPHSANYAPHSKQSPYEGGVRTPILIRWPGHIPPQVSNQLASSIDLMPTLLEAANVPIPLRDLPGVNLLDPQSRQNRTQVFGTCFTHNAIDLREPAHNVRWRWMIDQHYKLIVPDPNQEPSGKMEMYDLETDPQETVDLAAAQPDRVAALHRVLNAWWNPTP